MVLVSTPKHKVSLCEIFSRYVLLLNAFLSCGIKGFMNKKQILYLALVAILGLPGVFMAVGQNVLAETSFEADPTIPEIHIGRNGAVTIEGLKIMQMANTTIFGRTTWDEAFIRWTIKTNQDTQIKKRLGDKMSVYDFKEGDYLSLEGYVEGGAGLSIMATKIVNWSDYTTQSSFSGTIKSIDTPEKQFTLTADRGGNITVILDSSTRIYRNKREILPKYLNVGDKITSMEGIYDTSSRIMKADKVNVYIDPKIFEWQNYQGILQTLPSDAKPITFILKIGGKDYDIILYDNPLIMNKARNTVTFSRFLVGDTIRIWGHIRADDDELGTIRAEVVRDINF